MIRENLVVVVPALDAGFFSGAAPSSAARLHDFPNMVTAARRRAHA
jgi:hypothetical protein